MNRAVGAGIDETLSMPMALAGHIAAQHLASQGVKGIERPHDYRKALDMVKRCLHGDADA